MISLRNLALVLALGAFVIVGISFQTPYATGSFYNAPRANGPTTLPGGVFWFLADSTETLSIDTIVSDPVLIDSFKYVYTRTELTGFTLADSANDSVIIIVQTVTRGLYPGFETIIYADTFTTTLDSSESITNNWATDTIGLHDIIFRVIFRDSFVAGVNEDDNSDSNRYVLNHYIHMTGTR